MDVSDDADVDFADPLTVSHDSVDSDGILRDLDAPPRSGGPPNSTTATNARPPRPDPAPTLVVAVDPIELAMESLDALSSDAQLDGRELNKPAEAQGGARGGFGGLWPRRSSPPEGLAPPATGSQDGFEPGVGPRFAEPRPGVHLLWRSTEDALLGFTADAEKPRSVRRWLAGASPIALGEVGRILARDPGAVIVVDGTMELPFDRRELLRATVACAAPLGALDPTAKEILVLAGQLLSMPMAQTSDLPLQLVQGLREAWKRVPHRFPPDFLVRNVDRFLEETRAYRISDVLGGPHARGYIQSAGATVPVYLPKSCLSSLPVASSFVVRIAAEVHPEVDAIDASPASLRVIAVARLPAG